MDAESREIRECENPPKNTAINHGMLPPRMNTAMRVAKERLCDATRDNNLMPYMDATKMQDVITVKKWVMMEGRENKTTAPRGVSSGNDVDNNLPPLGRNSDIPLSPPAINTKEKSLLSTPANVVSKVAYNVVSITPNADGDFIRSKFPSLAVVSPRLAVRGRNMVAGMDMDLLLFQGVLADSVKLCEYHNESLSFTYSNGKHGVRLIKLPMSKNNRGEVKPNIAACIDELLSVAEEAEAEVGEDYVADLLLNYLLKKHKTKVLEKLRERKLIPKVIDEFDMGALLDRSRIKVWQWRKIHQCLRLFMGISKVCVPERRFRDLGADHGEITHGTYYYSDPANPKLVKEQVRYWDPEFVFLQALEGLVNGYSLCATEINYIHMASGGDHGKSKFRYAGKLIVCMNDGNVYTQVFGLADVACRKDHSVILENTCLPAIRKGINKINKSDVLFSYDEGNGGTLSISFVESNKHVSSFCIRPTSFLIGDLAFLAVMMGKENYSGSWCNWCKCTKEEWATGADVGDNHLWDIGKINEQVATNISMGNTDAKMLGVRREPYTEIPFNNIIFSGLHAGIGIGNRIIKHLETFIDVSVEHVSPEEFQLREKKKTAEHKIKQIRDQKEVWLNSPDGGRLLQTKKNRIKRLDIEMKSNTDATSNASKMDEKNQLLTECAALIETREMYSAEVSRLNNIIRKARPKLLENTKDRRKEEDSIYTAIDKIFQKYGANRAHYFGREFEGIDIRKIMASADSLFGVGGEIRAELLKHASNETVVEKIHKTCHDVGLALKLWDGAFSYIHAIDPSEEHCNNTQKRIDMAMAQIRAMGFSITPKMHGMEKHVVNQMRTIPGGIGRLMEHWIEQYHQVGHRFDMAYCRVGSLKGQAEIRARAEKRGSNPRVQMKKKLLDDTFTKKKRKRSAIANDEKALQVKRERREIAAITDICAHEYSPNKCDLVVDGNEKLDDLEELGELEELEELEASIFGEASDNGNEKIDELG